MDKTKVTIDGIEYEVDLAKAKEQGLIKEIKPRITDFSTGDMFCWGREDNGTEFLVIMPSECGEVDKYNACCFRGSRAFKKNTFQKNTVFVYTALSGCSKEKILSTLNNDISPKSNDRYFYKGNILNKFFEGLK